MQPTNTVTVANVETLVGGTGDDVITVSNSVVGALDLGSGDDQITLAMAATR